MDNTYVDNIKKLKGDYFEKMIAKLNIPGVSTPYEYLAWANGITVEEYEELMDFSDDSSESEEE